MPIKIVAEAAMYHEGSAYKAFQLIREAREAGADAVKFQVWKTDKFIAQGHPLHAMFAQAELKDAEWHEIKDFADDAGIELFATPLDLDSLDLLMQLDVPCLKVASCDITYKPLLEKISQCDKPIILSVGGATEEEVHRAVGWLWSRRDPNIILAHCTVAYPCPDAEVNLERLKMLQLIFPGYGMGLSDHTHDGFASVLAVPYGIVYAEKHMAFKPMPDGAVGSFGFSEYVRIIRRAEAMMGSRELKPTDGEREQLSLGRRSPITWRREVIHA